MRDKEEVFHELCVKCKSRITESNGKRQFPCNLIQITLLADDSALVWGQDKDEVQSQLNNSVRNCLKRNGCVELPDIKINVSFIKEKSDNSSGTKESDFAVSFHKITTIIRSASLCIFPDTPQQKLYPLGQGRYNIGRGNGGRYRGIDYINDISFEDNGKDPNAGVGGCHAKIEFDKRLNQYLLYDLESKNKTKLVRDGMTYPVDHVNGQRLQNGDYLYFGRAPARFKLEVKKTSQRC